MVMEIPLTQGKVALVDDEDYDHVTRHKWFAHTSKNLWYALRSGRWYGGVKSQPTRMHQIIVCCPTELQIDHIDGNGLNNQKSNLRFVTQRENCQNHHRITSLIYPGVTWHKDRGYWVARAQINGRNLHLGCYQSEYDAYVAYQTAVNNITQPMGVIP